MTDTNQWRWVDADGTQYAVGTDELCDKLRSGALPPYVLVWKAPWGEWLHAMNVVEFAAVLGSRANSPLFARLDPSAPRAPLPPLEKYDQFGHVRASLLSEAQPPAPLIVSPPKLSEAQPARRPIPLRNVLPTLTEESLPGRSDTLRPAGAIPPPPRAIPPMTRVPVFEDFDRSSTPSADFGPAPLPELRSVAGLSAPKPPESGVPVTQPASSAARPSRRALWAATAAGAALSIAALSVWLTRAGGQPSAAPSAPSASAKVAARDRSSGGCLVETTARRLSPGASVVAPPILTDLLEGTRVALGYAAEETKAVGLTLDPVTLALDVAFQKDVGGELTGVVPVVADGPLTFAADVASTAFESVRTVGELSRFTLGLTPKGIARRDAVGQHLVWPLESAEKISVPRVASLRQHGHAVAVRSGDRDGRILVGWLTPAGRAASELSPVAGSDPLVGTPAIAGAAEAALLTFAGRTSEQSTWGIRLSRVLPGRAPEAPKPFALPPGGPGQNGISPTAAALSGGRYFLQWTEGAAGSRAVRAITLSSTLEPLGDPITLSPPGENAGQGVLWARDERALALYFVQKDRTHELWGVTLRCPQE